MAELKGVVYELLEAAPEGLKNAEIGRALGIYQGHVRHQGHISRTILALLESEQVAVQDTTTLRWTLRRRDTHTDDDSSGDEADLSEN